MRSLLDALRCAPLPSHRPTARPLQPSSCLRTTLPPALCVASARPAAGRVTGAIADGHPSPALTQGQSNRVSVVGDGDLEVLRPRTSRGVRLPLLLWRLRALGKDLVACLTNWARPTEPLAAGTQRQETHPTRGLVHEHDSCALLESRSGTLAGRRQWYRARERFWHRRAGESGPQAAHLRVDL